LCKGAVQAIYFLIRGKQELSNKIESKDNQAKWETLNVYRILAKFTHLLHHYTLKYDNEANFDL